MSIFCPTLTVDRRGPTGRWSPRSFRTDTKRLSPDLTVLFCLENYFSESPLIIKYDYQRVESGITFYRERAKVTISRFNFDEHSKHFICQRDPFTETLLGRLPVDNPLKEGQGQQDRSDFV